MSLFLITPRVDPQPLLRRLAKVGFRRELASLVQGSCLTIAVPLALVALIGMLDHRLNLPSFVRALGLVGTLIATGIVFRRYLLIPMREPNDPIALALLIENQNPDWNDALASAIQFVDDDRHGSKKLRDRAIQDTIDLSDAYEFDELIDGRSVRRASLLFLLAIAIVTPFLFLAPRMSQTAVARQLDPFGGHSWTTIRITEPKSFPARLARGLGFDLAFTVSGRIPDRATLTLWPDDGSANDQIVPLGDLEPDHGTITIPLPIESDRVSRSFRFRLRAGDGDTGWQSVAVLPPPVLVPIDGRPSPVLRVEFPRYTDQQMVNIGDGISLIECVPGSVVHLRGAIDRPIAMAKVTWRADRLATVISSWMSPFGANSELSLIGLAELSQSVTTPTELHRLDEGRLIEGAFMPRLPGIYVLSFTDETGLTGTRSLEVRMSADPSPTVFLDQPIANREALYFVPTAELPVHIRATDKVFALNRVGLEYKLGGTVPTRAIEFHDGERLSQAMNAVTQSQGFRFRPTQWETKQKLSLSRFKHTDGSALKENDVLILNAFASDFDDVTTFKEPGRSAEVSIRIVSASTLETILQQSQLKMRQEIEQLHNLQQNAHRNVQSAIKELRDNGKLRPTDIEKLQQAEQLQQQIRARLSAPDEGLRTEVDRLRQMARENQLPSSPTTRRLDSLANELERLTEEDLVPIEPLIAQARRELDSAEPTKTPRNDALSKAESHQQQSEDALNRMLERLEPWDAANELKGQAKNLLNEIQRLANETQELGKTLPKGTDPNELNDEQRNALKRLGVRQDRQADAARQLNDQLSRLSDDKKKQLGKLEHDLAEFQKRLKQTETDLANAVPGSDDHQRLTDELQLQNAQMDRQQEKVQQLKAEVQALANAQQQSSPAGVQRELRNAASDLRQNKIGTAQDFQKEANNQLERLLQTLEEKSADGADRLRKKSKDLKSKLDELTERQETLQKKVELAKTNPDQAAREAEMQRLAQEQERIEKLTREVAKELSDANADNAAKELRRAARLMDESRQQLEQGQPSEETQDDALDRLDETQRQLQKDEKEEKEELGREEIRKLLDEVKAIKERQVTAIAEMQRIHQEVLKSKWSRPLQASLIDLKDRQLALGEELRGLIDKRFSEERVFAKMLGHAIDAMSQAAEKMEDRALEPSNPFDPELESFADQTVQQHQKLALRRLQMVIDILDPSKQKKEEGDPANGEPPMPMQGGNAQTNPNVIPPMAQLKALRELQAELNERTTAFAKDHPKIDELTEPEEAELAELKAMQDDIADLLRELLPLLEQPGATP